MIDMFPTRPTEWSKPPVFTEAKKQTQNDDITIHHVEDQKAYFHKALFGRKVLVGIGDALRRLFGKKFSWFNQVETKSSKKLYLGMIPDDLVKRKIPEKALFVSVLQDFEVEHMDKKTESFRVVVNSEDNVGMKPHEIDRGVEALHAGMKEQLDVPVYLHCKSGVGRSATVLAAYFMRYENMTLDQAIDRVQRDRPDAQLRGWFGRDNKHTKALREYVKARVLGNVELSAEEERLLNPELLSSLAGKSYQEREKFIRNIDPESIQRVPGLLIERLLLGNQFHTDTLPDIPGVTIPVENQSPTFKRYLQKVDRFGWEKPSMPGGFSKHAGWEVKSLPTETEEKKTILVRALGLKDGERERLGSVVLQLPSLTLAEVNLVIAALDYHARNRNKPFILEKGLKKKVEKSCEDFLTNCDQTLEKMRRELVGL